MTAAAPAVSLIVALEQGQQALLLGAPARTTDAVKRRRASKRQDGQRLKQQLEQQSLKTAQDQERILGD